jgi:hypothetical protein
MNYQTRRLLAAAAISAVAISHAQAQVLGDIAIVGRVNNGSPDSFAFVTLNPITAGTTIYFTDNGWTGTQFRGASATDGDGSENIARWQAVNAISAGRVIRTTDTSPNFTWTLTGLVGGSTTSGSYADLSFSQSGDQIYAFTTSNANNPLFNPATHLFAFDDTGTFENANNSNTGNDTTGGQGFTFSPNPLPGLALVTDLTGSRTPAQWMTYITTPGNWSSSATGDLSPLPASITVVPEPEEYAAMAGAALVGFALWRRRQAAK